MKTVLAFGDSLTFGADPSDAKRHPPEMRWPNVVAARTGFEVIAEGLRGRTTSYDQPSSPANLNGAALLPTLLHSHSPIDILAIMLGTNDCYFGFGAHKAQIGLTRLIEIARHHPFRMASHVAPQILLMAPPPMRKAADDSVSAEMIAQSQELVGRIEELALREGTAFFDASAVATAAQVDGIHLDEANTKAIGEAVAPVISSLVKP